jgi:hypothetical protein
LLALVCRKVLEVVELSIGVGEVAAIPFVVHEVEVRQERGELGVVMECASDGGARDFIEEVAEIESKGGL